MTTIIAVRKDNGSVDVAWDSLVSPIGTSYPKVASVNNQFYFGSAGHLRYLNILQTADVPVVHEKEFDSDDFEPLTYIIESVVPAWLDALERNSKSIPDAKDDWPWGVGMIVIKGRIFSIGADFAVSESETSYGIGSGADYARGAVAAGKTAEKAIQIAAELDLGTGGDLHILKGLK